MVDAPSTKARAIKIADIKRQIAAGTYDTPERLAEALDRFLDSEDSGVDRPAGESPNRPK